MYSIEIRIEWDAAHRLLNYVGKCSSNHGHRYSAIISMKTNTLTNTGFVIDFTDVKKDIKSWIDSHWDHGSILNKNDIEFIDLLLRQGNTCYLMNTNPTAENMCRELFDVIEDMGYEEILESVSIYETPTSMATYRKVNN